MAEKKKNKERNEKKLISGFSTQLYCPVILTLVKICIMYKDKCFWRRKFLNSDSNFFSHEKVGSSSSIEKKILIVWSLFTKIQIYRNRLCIPTKHLWILLWYIYEYFSDPASKSLIQLNAALIGSISKIMLDIIYFGYKLFKKFQFITCYVVCNMILVFYPCKRKTHHAP